MRIVLPSAKLAFQYTQEVPAQITKYCQLMNRPCTASEAINSVTFAYKKTPKHPNKKKKIPQNTLFPFIQNTNRFSALGGKFSTCCPTAGMGHFWGTPWKIIPPPNGWQPF